MASGAVGLMLAEDLPDGVRSLANVLTRGIIDGIFTVFHRRYRSQDGIEICVGKNSLQNDRRTGSARGGETWLHAKDMPGSHVIIRTEGEVPPTTLKQAAQWAAWDSKGQRSSSVPGDYTLRKYVKKPGGAPPGFVH